MQEGHIWWELYGEKILEFEAGNQKLRWFIREAGFWANHRSRDSYQRYYISKPPWKRIFNFYCLLFLESAILYSFKFWISLHDGCWPHLGLIIILWVLHAHVNYFLCCLPVVHWKLIVHCINKQEKSASIMEGNSKFKWKKKCRFQGK